MIYSSDSKNILEILIIMFQFYFLLMNNQCILKSFKDDNLYAVSQD
jgi:hypothetical protein